MNNGVPLFLAFLDDFFSLLLCVYYADEYSRDKAFFKDAVQGRAEITAKQRSGQTGVGTLRAA